MNDRNAFLVDEMLGRLKTYLRMCGYDTKYIGDIDDVSPAKIESIVNDESRILLTRNRQLSQTIDNAIYIKPTDIEDQLQILVHRDFELSMTTPTRCSHCNGILSEVTELGSTPAYAPDPNDEQLWQCKQCGHFYWKGSHWDDVKHRIEMLSK
ncbi:MAG: Mut7-C RNAse domain-containing protein [Halobacteriaceae archaeon]